MNRAIAPSVVVFVSYMVATILLGASAWLMSNEHVWERITSGAVVRDIEQAMEGR